MVAHPGGPTHMRLILITPEADVTNELQHANRMLASGLACLHVRKPRHSLSQARAYLDGIHPDHRRRVVLHQHHELARGFGLQGIHWRKADRPAAPLPEQPGLTQSTGFHALEDLHQDWRHLDYAFLSPIYDSISKPGYAAAVFPPDALRRALTARSCRVPVYALGGITPGACVDLSAMGFAGCAAIGAVWAAKDPWHAFQQLQAACQRAAASRGAAE